MAIDTAQKRFSMMNFGVSWAGGVLPVADGNDMDSDDQRQMMLGLYSGFSTEAGEPGAGGVLGGKLHVGLSLGF